jgi:L-alanine-DL-glutamate epimerase-like enolase superfamily enzyme
MVPALSTSAKISDLSISVFEIPTDAPESDGTLQWNHTTMVLVEAHAADTCGLGYTYADRATAVLVQKLLSEIVRGRDAMDVSGNWREMVRAIRNLGRPGIASMATAAVDNALWDLKARLLGIPLVKLLGMVHDSIPVYGSGGFTSYSDSQLQNQLSGWAESGIQMVKMKVGRDPWNDGGRVRLAREAIGADTELFVDANGAYSRKQALALAEKFREYDVTWLEEPVSSDDLEGLRLIRDRAPAGMDIAAGEYGYDSGYFRRMLAAGAVDVLQADATRCAGITGFLAAAVLCEAHCMPLSAHAAPGVHAHLCCAVRAARHLEYFHDHVRIEHQLFEGSLQLKNGRLYPDLSRPGNGLELRKRDAERYLAA